MRTDMALMIQYAEEGRCVRERDSFTSVRRFAEPNSCSRSFAYVSCPWISLVS